MTRSSVWVPLAVGLLFLVFGIATGSPVGSLIGITILSVIVTLSLRTDWILRKESIIDQWSTLVENAQGKANGVFQATNANIDASKAPHVVVHRQRLTSESTGEFRPFLIVSNNQNSNLRGFQMQLSCRDYGTNLVVDWYVTYTPSFWQAAVAMLTGRTPSADPISALNVFDQQDLRAYTTNAHRSMLGALEAVMQELNQDPSKIDRRSRGFLGIS